MPRDVRLLLFCLKIFFTLKNSDDPDEMPHIGAFHLGHCLLKYPFMGIQYTGIQTILVFIAYAQTLPINSNDAEVFIRGPSLYLHPYSACENIESSCEPALLHRPA